MKQIPVIIHGQQCGTVHVCREGAYMVCRGQVRYSGEMLRLWVYGTGQPGYLGVLIPDGQGGATVRKKFSLADFARLPNPIDYCGPEREEAVSSSDSVHEADTLWYALEDGTLVRFERGHRFVAFPADGVRLPRGGEFLVRQIEGRQYVVFPS